MWKLGKFEKTMFLCPSGVNERVPIIPQLFQGRTRIISSEWIALRNKVFCVWSCRDIYKLYKSFPLWWILEASLGSISTRNIVLSWNFKQDSIIYYFTVVRFKRSQVLCRLIFANYVIVFCVLSGYTSTLKASGHVYVHIVIWVPPPPPLKGIFSVLAFDNYTLSQKSR